ncbi:hypothetical protein JCGZ_21896 [Jatropha curcas]|uniref:Uncharacterized protein n=2 Tax=Jatropha curcas TaxID=180498 RepID=A0A067JN26_JATCU|nr:hypothetical protein JCGZ_21896 [Jatropha curcas]
MICIIIVGVILQPSDAAPKNPSEKYKACFNNCVADCKKFEGGGETFCEMKCDSDCTAKEEADDLNIKLP